MDSLFGTAAQLVIAIASGYFGSVLQSRYAELRAREIDWRDTEFTHHHSDDPSVGDAVLVSISVRNPWKYEQRVEFVRLLSPKAYQLGSAPDGDGRIEIRRSSWTGSKSDNPWVPIHRVMKPDGENEAKVNFFIKPVTNGFETFVFEFEIDQWGPIQKAYRTKVVRNFDRIKPWTRVNFRLLKIRSRIQGYIDPTLRFSLSERRYNALNLWLQKWINRH